MYVTRIHVILTTCKPVMCYLSSWKCPIDCWKKQLQVDLDTLAHQQYRDIPEGMDEQASAQQSDACWDPTRSVSLGDRRLTYTHTAHYACNF